MPLIDHDSVTPVEMLPGVVRRTLTDGDRLMLIEVTADEGAVVPRHAHPHEQTGYLISGRFFFELGDEKRDLGPGDCWLVPSNVPHQVTALEPCVFVDIFSPPREEYRADCGIFPHEERPADWLAAVQPFLAGVERS